MTLTSYGRAEMKKKGFSFLIFFNYNDINIMELTVHSTLINSFLLYRLSYLTQPEPWVVTGLALGESQDTSFNSHQSKATSSDMTSNTRINTYCM